MTTCLDEFGFASRTCDRAQRRYQAKSGQVGGFGIRSGASCIICLFVWRRCHSDELDTSVQTASGADGVLLEPRLHVVHVAAVTAALAPRENAVHSQLAGQTQITEVHSNGSTTERQARAGLRSQNQKRTAVRPLI